MSTELLPLIKSYYLNGSNSVLPEIQKWEMFYQLVGILKIISISVPVTEWKILISYPPSGLTSLQWKEARWPKLYNFKVYLKNINIGYI